jgi:hypothetical protein
MEVNMQAKTRINLCNLEKAAEVVKAIGTVATVVATAAAAVGTALQALRGRRQ